MADNDFKSAIDGLEATKEAKDRVFDGLSKYDGKSKDHMARSVNAFLSSNLVVKEHRLRYQEEQFERFQYMVQTMPNNPEHTLRDYAFLYGLHMDELVKASHNYKSPKIDANYDDFDSKKINPITAATKAQAGEQSGQPKHVIAMHVCDEHPAQL